MSGPTFTLTSGAFRLIRTTIARLPGRRRPRQPGVFDRVHLCTRDGRFVVEATDTYRLYEASIAHDGNDWDVLVPARWLSHIVTGPPDDVVTLMVDGDRFIVSAEDALWSTNVIAPDPPYPGTAELLGGTTDHEDGSAFNPDYLGDVFATAAAWRDDREPVKVVALHPWKPARFALTRRDGWRLRMLLMPVRVR